MFYPGASFHLAALFTTNQKRMRRAGETFNFEPIFMPAMSRNTMYWLFQIGGWGLFALINIFFAYSFEKLPQDQRMIFGRLIIFISAGLIFSHMMRYIIIGLGVLQKKLEILPGLSLIQLNLIWKLTCRQVITLLVLIMEQTEIP